MGDASVEAGGGTEDHDEDTNCIANDLQTTAQLELVEFELRRIEPA